MVRAATQCYLHFKLYPLSWVLGQDLKSTVWSVMSFKWIGQRLSIELQTYTSRQPLQNLGEPAAHKRAFPPSSPEPSASCRTKNKGPDTRKEAIHTGWCPPSPICLCKHVPCLENGNFSRQPWPHSFASHNRTHQLHPCFQPSIVPRHTPGHPRKAW